MNAVEVERREMRRTTAWTYRCPARHQLVVTVQGREEPVRHRVLFEADHIDCVPAPSKEQARAEA